MHVQINADSYVPAPVATRTAHPHSHRCSRGMGVGPWLGRVGLPSHVWPLPGYWAGRRGPSAQFEPHCWMPQKLWSHPRQGPCPPMSHLLGIRLAISRRRASPVEMYLGWCQASGIRHLTCCRRLPKGEPRRWLMQCRRGLSGDLGLNRMGWSSGDEGTQERLYYEDRFAPSPCRWGRRCGTSRRWWWNLLPPASGWRAAGSQRLKGDCWDVMLVNSVEGHGCSCWACLMFKVQICLLSSDPLHILTPRPTVSDLN